MGVDTVVTMKHLLVNGTPRPLLNLVFPEDFGYQRYWVYWLCDGSMKFVSLGNKCVLIKFNRKVKPRRGGVEYLKKGSINDKGSKMHNFIAFKTQNKGNLPHMTRYYKHLKYWSTNKKVRW